MNHGYTEHGHVCCAALDVANHPDRPSIRKRCGGPVICSICAQAAAHIHSLGSSAQEPTPAPEGAAEGQNTAATTEEPFSPRLWDVPPDSVTHIAGAQLHLFGRYLRQRCDWCGVIIIEYDLARVMVPEGQTTGTPAMWPVGGLIRVDGHMSAEVESVEDEPGVFRLPMDSCAFNPLTQVGM